jgi:hypothetical protein
MSVEYLRIPKADAGRLGFGLGVTLSGLPANTPAELIEHGKAAHAAALAWFEQQQSYKKQTRSTARGETQRIDRAVDRLLGQVHQICTGLAVLGDSRPEGIAAQAFLEQFFPNGLAAVTQVKFEDQLALMEQMRDALPAAQATVDALPIGALLDAVMALLPDYRAELTRSNNFVTADAVRAAEQHARRLLARFVTGVHYTFGAELFDALLAPLTAQVRRYRAALKVSRRVDDVDPQTGEVLEA